MSLIASSKKKTVMLTMAGLGIAMIAIGFVPLPHISLPPILTGAGFLTLAWGMNS